MRKLLRNFWLMTPKKTVIFGQNVEGKMNAESGIYSAPTPPINSLTSKRLELEAAIVAAKDGGLVQRQTRDALCREYKQMLLQLSAYVQMAVSDDAELMERSGFTLSKVPQKVGALPQVQGLNTFFTEFSGELLLKWLSIYGAHNYTLEYRKADATTWSAVFTTKVTITLSFLEPRTDYVFRVAAVGTAGQGPWSEVVPSFVV